MASIKILLKDNQPKKDGTIPVLIRVTVDRKSKYISTGYSVKASQFREGTENWIVKHSDSVLMNAAIESKRAAIAKELYEADIAGRKFGIDDLGKKNKGTFFYAVRLKLKTYEDRNMVGMFYKLRAKLKALKDAWGRDVSLGEINADWVAKFVSYRIGKGTKISTIKKDLTMFSSVLQFMDYEGKDYFRKAQSSLKAEPPMKEKLTLEEIRLIEQVKLAGMNDIARDMFLFAYYCQGMRFQNVAMFESGMIKNGLIRYRMNKGKKIREIPVHERLGKIISKYHGDGPYLFPVIKRKVVDGWDKKNLVGSANAMINTHLKRVAIVCGIDKVISTHISRHTFAYLSLERGVSMEILKDALGHSSFATTRHYLTTLSDKKINEAVSGLYD